MTFASTDCLPCPARQLCTISKAGRRQLTVPPREVHQLQTAAREAEKTQDWQARYVVRAGVEAPSTRPSTSGSAGPAIAFPRRS
ncbi:MAG: transposase [Catenulisporales bacterium]|nr:transposase [Catenulisporales bacterium]